MPVPRSRLATAALLLLALVGSSVEAAFNVSSFKGYLPLQKTGDTVVVQTTQGALRGDVVNVIHDPRIGGDGSPTGQKVAVFQGVHYAKKPVRFEKPLPPDPWKGVKNATEIPPNCHGFVKAADDGFNGLMTFVGSPTYNFSEDCLWMNIHTPANLSTPLPANGTSTKPLLPVLLFIHGGGFNAGGANAYVPQDMVDLYCSRGMIVILVEYRLGVAGFGTNGTKGWLGNYGAWDQTEALKWIKQNIRVFGGNPNNVTVSGLSAGGASTSMLSLSTHSRDLFQQAIPLSGSILNGWAFYRQVVVNETIKVAAKLGCASPGQDMKKCMQSKTIEEIMDATSNNGTYQNARPDIYGIRFGPHMDGDFFTEDPLELVKTAPKKPTLMGVAELEMGVYVTHDYEAILHDAIPQEKWANFTHDDFAAYIRQYIATPAQYGKDSPTVQNKIIDYFSNYSLRNYNTDWDGTSGYWIRQTIHIASQLMFLHTKKIEARTKAALGWPVYYYLTTYWNRCTSDHSQLPVRASQHARETPYWYNLWIYPIDSPFPVTNYSKDDIAYQNLGVDTMVQFCKTGNPTLPGAPQAWPLVKPNGTLDFMRLDTQASRDKDLWDDQEAFWEGIRKDYPQFDIMRADGAPPANSTTTAAAPVAAPVSTGNTTAPAAANTSGTGTPYKPRNTSG